MDLLMKRFKLGKSKSKTESNVIGDLEVLKQSYLRDFKVQYGKVLGEGISGKVRCVTCLATQDKFAMKTLPDSQDSRAEIELQLRCAHPNVAKIERVYSNVIDGRRKLVVIMELVPGEDLFDRILRRDSQPLTEKRVAEIVRSLCQVVAHMHGLNVAHRDVKPENILMTSKSDDAEMKLIDFGFSKVSLGSDSLETPCFTPYYAAPEVLADGKYGKACDPWSIGVLTYILMCGYPPFSASRKGTGARPSFSRGMKSRIQAGSYKYPASDWDQVSEEGMDFIRGLLNTDPASRMTVEQALEHKWLTAVAATRLSHLVPRSARQQDQPEEKAASGDGAVQSDDQPAVFTEADLKAGDSLGDTTSTDTGISVGTDSTQPSSSASSPSSSDSTDGIDSSITISQLTSQLEEESGKKSPTLLQPLVHLTNPLLERRRAKEAGPALKISPVSTPKRGGSPVSCDSGISPSTYSPMPDPGTMPLVYV